MIIKKSTVIALPSERKTVEYHGGENGDYHCDNCEEAMLPSEIAYQNSENTYDYFCSVSCLETHAHCNNY